MGQWLIWTQCVATQPSSKQLTNAAVVVSVMVVERGGRLDGSELWMHSAQEVEEECGVYVC